MRLLALVLAVAAALAGATSLAPLVYSSSYLNYQFRPRLETCEDLSCASKEELLDVIRQLHRQRDSMGMNHIGVFQVGPCSPFFF